MYNFHKCKNKWMCNLKKKKIGILKFFPVWDKITSQGQSNLLLRYPKY